MRLWKSAIIAALLILLCLSGCVQPAPGTHPWLLDTGTVVPSILSEQTAKNLIPTQRPADSAYMTPTADAGHALPTLRTNSEQYIVQPGDSLASIAEDFNVDVNSLAAANSITTEDWLQAGQTLSIPAPKPTLSPSEFKIIPDSELVYGPVSSTLDVKSFIQQHGGYLSHYTEIWDGSNLSGADIIEQLSKEYSVNPRLLLALLEYQSGWVTQGQPSDKAILYPLGYKDPTRQGLYRQVSWAANELNRGYYLWKVGAISTVLLPDGNLVSFPGTINAGTVAVQRLLALTCNAPKWSIAVSRDGVYAAYTSLFGIPFDYSVEPLLPAGLSQPEMRLPFEKGDTWSFTGGPHSAWGDGAAWAALDFAPPSEVFGCYTSNIWEVAVADGVVVRSGNGEVVLDLDGDGLEQTGWTVIYLHVESRQRIAVGTRVKAGDRIGHPSCEGGVSYATHLHLARRYNGEWIAADGSLPFILDGWTSHGDGVEYNGTLTKDGTTLVAEDGLIEENQISR